MNTHSSTGRQEAPDAGYDLAASFGLGDLNADPNTYDLRALTEFAQAKAILESLNFNE